MNTDRERTTFPRLRASAWEAVLVKLFFLSVLNSLACSLSLAALPEPIDVPRGPAGVPAPGRSVVPEMRGAAPDGAPAISMINDVVLTGETLVITGDRLKAAPLKVWAGDGTL